MNETVLNQDDFISVKSCPYCKSNNYLKINSLPVNKYLFANKLLKIDFDIEINKCENCNLFFKSKIPKRELLVNLSNNLQEDNWNYEDYNYNDIRKIIIDQKHTNNLSVLDIGCFYGDFLRNTKDLFYYRSGLDFLKISISKDILNGEYINSFVEDLDKVNIIKEYDVITMFDVFEHLYDVNKALENLKKRLKKDGLLIIETGNALCKSSKEIGIQNWWYINLIVHHICVDSASIKRILESMGFLIIKVIEKRHKNKLKYSSQKKIKELVKYYILKVITPKYYFLILQKLKKIGFPPQNPAELDHILVIAKKI